MPTQKIPVLLAPAMTADHALSMDLYLVNLQAALAPFGERFEFEVVVPPTRPDENWFLKQWKRYVGFPWMVSRRVRARRGTVVHVLDHSYGHLCRRGVPSIVTCHGLENFRLKLPYFWQQSLWLYRVKSMCRARRVAAISGDVAHDLAHLVGISPEKILVNYHGIETIFTPDGPTHTALDARRAAGELLVLHVGTNYRRKNVGLIIDAVGRLRAEGLPVRLVKVGDDPLADGYGPQMQALGLHEHFDYLGRLAPPALAQVYRSCHALAFPSLHEGFGRPIIEAQACGLPVVLADTASAREIAGQEGALFHPPADAPALAARLRTLLTDASTHARLRRSGAENVRRFSWAAHARTLTDLYADLHARN